MAILSWEKTFTWAETVIGDAPSVIGVNFSD